MSDQPKPQLPKRTVNVTAVSSYSGPIPPPEILGGYEQALPGCAERILAMAEREQQHRHSAEQFDLSTRLSLARRGQVMAFSIGTTGMVGGLILAGFDKSFAGLTSFLASLATLVGVYLYAAKRKNKSGALPSDNLSGS